MTFNTLADQSSLDTTVAALTAKNYQVLQVENGAAALAEIKTLVPKGASVMNGSSVSLEQIGFVEYLKSGDHGWDNFHAKILAETDKNKQAQLRKESLNSDYYLGSVHALMENGDFLVASNTGSQLPHIAFTSPNLVFVVGTQKIVPGMAEAMQRLEEYVVPLEDKHMQQKYQVNTFLSKILIFKGRSPFANRNITFILVNEELGF